jgi:hypothetical protein
MTARAIGCACDVTTSSPELLRAAFVLSRTRRFRVDDLEARVRARAHRLWLQRGRPPGGAEAYYDEARELVAIEDNPTQARKPRPRENAVGPSGEPVESIVPVENEADVPTLADQGEESTHPHRRR